MKEQYIKLVCKELTVPRRQKKDIIRDLEEAFASAKEHGETEEQVIERLGTPEEFAAGMSEMNAEIKKGVPVKTVAVILSAVILVAVIGSVAAAYLPKLFKFGNPIPYIKAAMQLRGDTHVARIIHEPDRKAKENGWEYWDYGIMTDKYPYIDEYNSCQDVTDYIWENFGVQFWPSYETEHGLACLAHTWRYTPSPVIEYVEVETFLDKYYVWKIGENYNLYRMKDNHELLDNLWGRAGKLFEIKRSEIIDLIGEPEEVTEEGMIYHDCLKREVLIKYNEEGDVVQILRDGEVVYPIEKKTDETDEENAAYNDDAVDEAEN